jgi:site-specific DNA-cytosine methylase
MEMRYLLFAYNEHYEAYEFIKAFEAIGYEVTYSVLNAADYGVAQGRERTIFICVRQDVCDAIGLNVLNLNGVFPPPSGNHVSIEDAIDDVINDPAEEQMLLDYVRDSYQKKFVDMLPHRPKKTLHPGLPEFRHLNPKGSCFSIK